MSKIMIVSKDGVRNLTPQEELEVKQGIQEIFIWQYRNMGSFYSRLLTALAKADGTNKERIKKGFPGLVCALDLWMKAHNPDDFFREWIPEFMKKIIEERDS